MNEEVFDNVTDASTGVESVIWSYELEPSFADEREIKEDKHWDYEGISDAVKEILFSKFFEFSRFFDSFSIWLPGHHRKIIITKIEEND